MNVPQVVSEAKWRGELEDARCSADRLRRERRTRAAHLLHEDERGVEALGSDLDVASICTLALGRQEEWEDAPARDTPGSGLPRGGDATTNTRPKEATMSNREQYPAGVPCFVDTLAPDVEAAKHFYGAVFGWEFAGPGAIPTEPPGSVLRRSAARP